MFLWILLLIVVVFLWKGTTQERVNQEGMTHAEIKTKIETNYSKITRYMDAVNAMVGKL
jgi:hypothetical protein